MRVLYVSHTAVVSGAERTLLDLLGGLPKDVQAIVASPEGDLADRVRELDVDWHRLPGTAGSLKLHPVRTFRAIGEIARAAISLRRLAAKVQADLIHANSVRAGLAAVGSRRLGGPPVLVHVHDHLAPGLMTTVLTRTLRLGADAFLSISAWAESGLEDQSAPVIRVGNPVDIQRFARRRTAALAREALGLPQAPTIGVVAQISPWKGQREAIQALIQLRERFSRLRLVLLGEIKFADPSTRFDNRTYLSDLNALIRNAGLVDAVDLPGEREDVADFLEAFDVLLVPSWGEPFGRSMIEAMAMETPVVATDMGGPAEVIDDGVSGRLVPIRDPSALAAAVGQLLEDDALRQQIASAGREAVAVRFERSGYTARIVDAYHRTLAAASEKHRLIRNLD